MIHKLEFFYLNIQHLQYRIEPLEILLAELEPHVIMFSEVDMKEEM